MLGNQEELRKIREELKLYFDFEESFEGSSDGIHLPIEYLKVEHFRPQPVILEKSYIFEVLRRGYLLNGEKLQLTVGNETVVLNNDGKNLELYKKPCKKKNK